MGGPFGLQFQKGLKLFVRGPNLFFLKKINLLKFFFFHMWAGWLGYNFKGGLSFL